MRYWRHVALAAGIALAVGCTGEGADGNRSDTVDMWEELTRRIRGYERALLGGDPAEVKGFWTPDARVLLPGLDLSGEAVAAFVDDFYAAGATVISVEFHTGDLFVHEGAAYELGRYEETARMGPDAEPLSVDGNYFLRWERGEDGVWRIDRFVAGPIEAPGGG